MRIGFIGVGGIATNYLKSLQKLKRPVAAVCDLNAERAAKVSADFGGKVFTDHREMLAQADLQAVFVAIPPGAHGTQVADAAKAKAAVFVAKPVALSLETARRSLDAISAAGVINQAGYMARYSDVAEKARALIGERKLAMGLGRFLCRMGAQHPWWGKKAVSGGQILEQSTHCFDLLRNFLGEATEAHAFGHKGLADDVADFEDATVCNLRFASGAVGSVTSTCCAKAEEGFAVELSGRDLYLKLVLDTKLRGQVDGQAVDYQGEEAGYFRQVEKFIEAVERKDQSLVRSSFEDAVRTLAVTVAATRSLETSRPEKIASV